MNNEEYINMVLNYLDTIERNVLSTGFMLSQDVLGLIEVCRSTIMVYSGIDNSKTISQ